MGCQQGCSVQGGQRPASLGLCDASQGLCWTPGLLEHGCWLTWVQHDLFCLHPLSSGHQEQHVCLCAAMSAGDNSHNRLARQQVRAVVTYC